jgi:hypothetical protein
MQCKLNVLLWCFYVNNFLFAVLVYSLMVATKTCSCGIQINVVCLTDHSLV